VKNFVSSNCPAAPRPDAPTQHCGPIQNQLDFARGTPAMLRAYKVFLTLGRLPFPVLQLLFLP
jgi:hypothetical protein